MYRNRLQLVLRPRPRWGSLQRSPRPLAVFKGPASKGKEREGEERREREGKRDGRGREGRGGGERPYTPLSQIPGYATGGNILLCKHCLDITMAWKTFCKDVATVPPITSPSDPSPSLPVEVGPLIAGRGSGTL